MRLTFFRSYVEPKGWPFADMDRVGSPAASPARLIIRPMPMRPKGWLRSDFTPLAASARHRSPALAAVSVSNCSIFSGWHDQTLHIARFSLITSLLQ